jgi:hypothetical protein
VQATKENGGTAPHLENQTSNLEVSGQLYAPSALPAKKALLVPNKINGERALKARMGVLQKIKLFCPYRQSDIYSIVPVVASTLN